MNENEKRPTDAELAEEARRWDTREITPAGWEDAADAVPRAGESVPVNIRLPKKMLALLKEFARREKIGYQVLMKRWLDDRIRDERERRQAPSPPPVSGLQMTILRLNTPMMYSHAASFDARAVKRLPDEATTDAFGRLAAIATQK